MKDPKGLSHFQCSRLMPPRVPTHSRPSYAPVPMAHSQFLLMRELFVHVSCLESFSPGLREKPTKPQVWCPPSEWLWHQGSISSFPKKQAQEDTVVTGTT